jgi:hypothetical protein
MVRNMTKNENPVSKEFPKLFHYTSVSAFENIYKEQKFRATHYEDLNDKSELKRFRLKVYEFIRPIIRDIFDERMQRDTQDALKIDKDGGLETVTNQEAAMHLEMLHGHTFGKPESEPFVCSFCGHDVESYEARNGLLSQWRGYGTDGGVAIVLNTLEIEHMMAYEQNTFAHSINHIGKVVYDDNDAEIKKEFYKVFEFFPKILKTLYSYQQPAYGEIYEHFIWGTTLVKHHGFHEENEVRIVTAPRTSRGSIFYNSEYDMNPSKVVRYTQKGDRESRYIEVFGHSSLPIERVIVGPSRIQNFNHQRISDLVKDSHIEVVKSQTPLLA